MNRIITLIIMMALASNIQTEAQSDYSDDYVGNIALTTEGGRSTENCIVIIGGVEYDGIKAGSLKIEGEMKLNVPAGSRYLHLHVAAWNGSTVTLVITPDGYTNSIILTGNSGISHYSPYTFDGDANTDDYYKVITFPNPLTEDTEFTLTATNSPRFVIWGVTAEGGPDPQAGEINWNSSAMFPLTVAEVLKNAVLLEPNQSSDKEVYVKGIVSRIECNFGVEDETATFSISDDGKLDNEFLCCKTDYIGDRVWVEGDDLLEKGDEVVVYGTVTNNDGVLEMTCNQNYLYSLNGKTADVGEQQYIVTPPSFSLETGVYHETQILTIMADEGTTIYYLNSAAL